MIDFYFTRYINLNDILKDGFEIKKVEGDNWLWFGLQGPDNEGVLHVNYDEEGYFDYAEGHSSKVAFYLYDKYGVLFHDDCEFLLLEVQDFLDLEDPSNYDDWNKIVEYVSLRHMQYYIHEGAGDIYTKLIEQTAKAKVDFDEVMERTGIQRKIDEKYKK